MSDQTKARRKNYRIGKVAAAFLYLVTMTMRVKVHDHCGFLSKRPDHPIIHAVWHNSIFSWPYAYRKHWPDRTGAALTSASKDGEIVAGALESFGIAPVRGSNSRRGAAAIIELKKWLKDGYDIAITPDGPRGPVEKLQPGIVVLAQKSGATIMPFRIEYQNPWRLKTWDKFQIPKPFSRADVHLEPYITVPEKLTEDEFEAERLKIEEALGCSES
ncbi:MAG: lysophospholipid acyltransferase family protein [Verrucomicrobiota bacterium]